jgi:hypothetical protein
MAKNSIVMVCKNIKLDKDYQNCLTYTEQQMYELCYDNKVDIANNFSFIQEEENSILVPFTYENCLKCNYLAFQNPRYSNKWFFAFIDTVNYVSDKTTRINFTTDVFSTWYDYWTAKTCFVEREHVNDDTVGVNLVDEGIPPQEYVVNNSFDLEFFDKDTFKPVIAVSEIVTSGGAEDIPFVSSQGGVFCGMCYVKPNFQTTADAIVRIYDEQGHADSIKYMFMCPSELITDTSYSYGGTLKDGTTTYNYSVIANNVSYSVSSGAYDKPTTIDTYNPVNKKLLQFPYCYLSIDPHSGNLYNFNYEDIYVTGGKYAVSCDAILSVGCSVRYTIPLYKNHSATSQAVYTYGFTGIKYPTCGWISDAYTNWLTQNAVNLGFTTISPMTGGFLKAGINALSGNIMGGIEGVYNSLQSDYRASMMPDQVRGNENSGDINFALGLVNPTVNEMSIKRDQARIIDDYFTRFGYKVNALKLPNQTGRTYFNFVKIGSSEIIGYPNSKGCPSDAMNSINNIYRSGVTLWHSHDRIGNYTGNSIV